MKRYKSHYFFSIMVSAILLNGLLLSSLHAFPVVVDDYEQKGKLEQCRNLMIVPPRVIVGNREALGQKLDEKSLLYQQVSRAVHLSAVSTFNKKGYGMAGIDDLKGLDDLWFKVTRFTDEGKYKKRKMLPYGIEDIKSALPGNTAASDAIVFVQIYGAFDYEITPKDEVGGTVAANVLVNAVTIPLMGVAVVGGRAGKYQQFDYKISIFEVSTGELIWYREGVKDGSDFRSWSMLMKSLEEVYDEQLPSAKDPVIFSKFKKKRSEIT